MNDNYTTNNRVFIMGEVVSEPEQTHTLYGEGFYEFYMSVPRLSGQSDIIPITVSERLMTDKVKKGEKISIIGQFRSYNKLENERSKLMLTVFERDFAEFDEDEENPNACELNGYVCKEPVYRTTPFNREICDILLAVNRGYNKSDYIPCIAWGRNARFVRNIKVGQNIVVSGRIQSRKYNKKLDEDTVVERTAYELSVCKISAEKMIDDETAITVDED